VDDDPAGPADEPAGGAPDPDQGTDWDEDLPVALGEETAVDEGDPFDDEKPEEGDELGDGDGLDEGDDGDGLDEGDDLGELPDDDMVGGRRNALPRRVESRRSRSATGAIPTALAMGLQQVFEPEKRRPAAVAEAPSDPYSDDDPITVDYVPDDAESTKVHVKPWLLQKGE